MLPNSAELLEGSGSCGFFAFEKAFIPWLCRGFRVGPGLSEEVLLCFHDVGRLVLLSQVESLGCVC